MTCNRTWCGFVLLRSNLSSNINTMTHLAVSRRYHIRWFYKPVCLSTVDVAVERWNRKTAVCHWRDDEPLPIDLIGKTSRTLIKRINKPLYRRVSRCWSWYEFSEDRLSFITVSQYSCTLCKVLSWTFSLCIWCINIEFVDKHITLLLYSNCDVIKVTNDLTCCACATSLAISYLNLSPS